MNNIIELLIRNRLFLIFFLALVLRLIPFLIYESWDNEVVQENILVSDAREYHKLGLHLLSTGRYPVNTFVSTKRTPVYPWFLASVYGLFGVKPYIILGTQVLINLVSLLLVHKISSLFFDRKIAIIGVVLYAIDPISILYTQTLMADTLVTTIFLLSIWFLVFSMKTNKPFFIVLGGMFLGLSSLTKPVFQFFPIVAIFITMIFFYKDWKKTGKYAFLFLMGFAMIVLPWLIRNYKLYDKAAITTIVGRNLLFENAARLAMEVDEISFDEAQKKFRFAVNEDGIKQLENPFEKEKLYRKMGYSYIKKHMLSYIGVNIKGVVFLYFTPGSTLTAKIFNHNYARVDDKTNLISNPSFIEWIKEFVGLRTIGELIISISVITYYLLMYVFVVLAIPVLFKEKNNLLFMGLCFLIILYITILTGPVGHARFRLPINPFLIMISSVGIHNFSTRLNWNKIKLQD